MCSESHKKNTNFRCVPKIAKIYYWLRHVRLSVRMEQLGPHWKDFRKIRYECFPKICRETSYVIVTRIMGTLLEGL